MKPSKRKFQQGGYYENKTDFVLKPMDYAALGAGYDEMTRKRLAEMDRAEKEQRKKDLEGIKDLEARPKVMERLNNGLQSAYDLWEDARIEAISNPTPENKQAAANAFNQYTTFKNESVAITTNYEKELNAVSTGSLDATLIGNRANALQQARDFDTEIPVQVVNGRVLMANAEGEFVDWTQSTYFNRSSFGQDGRNFLAMRKAPGTDFMFAPKSEMFAKEMTADNGIYKMSGGRRKGLDEVAVGNQIEQRFRTEFTSNQADIVEAMTAEYGAKQKGVTALNPEQMLEADANYGDPDGRLYGNVVLQDFNIVYKSPEQSGTEMGEYEVVFNYDPLTRKKADGSLEFSREAGAALKNRQNALKFHLENLANQTYFKLNNQYQPDPTTPPSPDSASSIPKPMERQLMTELGGVQDEDGKAVKGSYYTFRGDGLNLRYKGGTAKITNIQYGPEGNPFAFEIESNRMKDDIRSALTDEIKSRSDQANRLTTRVSSELDVTEREKLKEEAQELETQISELTEQRKKFSKSKASFIIDKDNQYFGSDIFQAGTPQDIPGFIEVLTSLLQDERALMIAIEKQTGGTVVREPVGSEEDSVPSQGGGLMSGFNTTE